MKRFCGFPPTPEFTGDLEEMSLLAGESVGQTKRLMSAASIIDEMISEAEMVIRKRLGSMVVLKVVIARPPPAIAIAAGALSLCACGHPGG